MGEFGQQDQQFLCGGFPITIREHEVAQPERQTINQARSVVGCTQRRGQFERGLMGGPGGCAPGAMGGNAGLHLVIECLGGGDIMRVISKA